MVRSGMCVQVCKTSCAQLRGEPSARGAVARGGIAPAALGGHAAAGVRWNPAWIERLACKSDI